MPLPREFEQILADIDSLCVSAEERQLSVFDVFEILTPITASPLLSAFPFIYDYVNAWESMIEDIWSILLSCQAIIRSSRYRNFVLHTTFEFVERTCNITRYYEYRYGCNFVMVKTHVQNSLKMSFYCGSPSLDAKYDLDENQDIPIDVFRKYIFEKISSRVDMKCINQPNSHNVGEFVSYGYMSMKSARPRVYEELKGLYGPLILQNTMMKFDPSLCRQDALAFRSRAEAKNIIGLQASDFIRYKPGNDGFDDSAAHFANMQLGSP